MSPVLKLIVPESASLLSTLLTDPRATETLPGFYRYCSKAAGSVVRTEDPYCNVARQLGLMFHSDDAFPHAAYSRYVTDRQSTAAVWLKLSPVQYTSASSGLILHQIDPNQLSQEEIDQLTDLLQTVAVESKISVETSADGAWLVNAEQHSSIETIPLYGVRDKPVALHLPAGQGATFWARWLAECEMTLHDHAFNRERENRGLPPVSGFWLWGGGPLPDATPTALPAQLLTTDLALQGMALRHGVGTAGFHLSDMDTNTTLVVAADLTLTASQRSAEDLMQWLTWLDEEWLRPALQMLARGRLSSLQLIDPAGGAAWRLNRIDLKKFWRTRPAFPNRI